LTANLKKQKKKRYLVPKRTAPTKNQSQGPEEKRPELTSSQSAYKRIKEKATKFNEEFHCPEVIRIIGERGKTVAAFCDEMEISDDTFYRWVATSKIFRECYRHAAMKAFSKWQEEGEEGKAEFEFNVNYWIKKGTQRFGAFMKPKIFVNVKHDANPLEQYRDVMRQASIGDFTSDELKQVLEAINSGTRAYETVYLQDQIDLLRQDVIESNGL